MKGSTLKKLMSCRRSIVSIFAIGCLTIISLYGLSHGLADVSGIALAIAGIAGSLSGANAFEATKTGKSTDGKVDSPD